MSPEPASRRSSESPEAEHLPRRRCDSGADPTGELVSPQFPLQRLIPRSSWAYGWAGGMATLLVATLTWAAWPGAGGAAPEHPLWTRLLVPPQAELVTGVGTVALGLAGQLALLIGWGRSRSLVDYAGQYRIWTRAGLACWLFAAVSRLGLDGEWRDWALSQNWPRFWNDTQLLVLLPTLLAGASLGAGLRREVARCQPSRTLLMLATTLYLSTVGVKLGSGSALTEVQRLLVIQNGLLAAHLTLLLCFWIHARHVLYESCDPVGESRRSHWLPAPHWLVRLRQRSGGPGSLVNEPTSCEPENENPPGTVDAEVTSKPPAELADLVKRPDAPDREIGMANVSGQANVIGPAKSRTRPVVSGKGQRTNADLEQGLGDGLGLVPNPTGGNTGVEVPESRTEVAGEVPSAPATDDLADSADQPSLKGLSKRERRRLQQEERLKGGTERG